MAEHVHPKDMDDRGLAVHLSTPKPEGHGHLLSVQALEVSLAVGTEWGGWAEHEKHHESVQPTAPAPALEVQEGAEQEQEERAPGTLNVGAMAAMSKAAPEEMSGDGGSSLSNRESVGDEAEVPIGLVGSLGGDEIEQGWGFAGTGPVLMPEEIEVLRTGKGAQFVITWANARASGETVYFRAGLRPWMRPASGTGLAVVTEVPKRAEAVVVAALQRAAEMLDRGDEAVYVWEAEVPEPTLADASDEEIAQAAREGRIGLTDKGRETLARMREERADGSVKVEFPGGVGEAEIEQVRQMMEDAQSSGLQYTSAEPDPAAALEGLRRYRATEPDPEPDPDMVRVGEVTDTLAQAIVQAPRCGECGHWFHGTGECRASMDSWSTGGLPCECQEATLAVGEVEDLLGQMWAVLGAAAGKDWDRVEDAWLAAGRRLAYESWLHDRPTTTQGGTLDPTEGLSPGDHYTAPWSDPTHDVMADVAQATARNPGPKEQAGAIPRVRAHVEDTEPGRMEPVSTEPAPTYGLPYPEERVHGAGGMEEGAQVGAGDAGVRGEEARPGPLPPSRLFAVVVLADDETVMRAAAVLRAMGVRVAATRAITSLD